MARTILLADDSVTAQNMGRRILMDAGYEVVTVNNGSAALKKIHESHPDLIVLDVYMPGYGGLEVCQRLKESAETARIPVLLSVGKMEPFKAEEARRVRADGHIVKPFEASELLAALTKLEDKIIPHAESASGRREKAEKKSEYTKDPLAVHDDSRTERVAYLSQAKSRQSTIDAASNKALNSGYSSRSGGQSGVELSRDASIVAPPVPTAPAEAAAVHETDSGSKRPGRDETAEVELQTAEPTGEIPVQSVAWDEDPTCETSAYKGSAIEAAAGAESNEKSESEVASEQTAIVENPPAASNSSGAPCWVAETVALTPEEASIALEEEMQQANAASAVAQAQPEIAAQEQVSNSSEAVAQADPQAAAKEEAEKAADETSDNPSGAAFAAAASAAVSGQSPAVSTEAVSDAALHTTASSQPELPVPSEAVAAWENWQQIREAVMSPQKAAAIAESVALIAEASFPPKEPAAIEESTSDVTSTAVPAEEDNSINDIVDSVLADLKPRLMAEITKKLAAKK